MPESLGPLQRTDILLPESTVLGRAVALVKSFRAAHCSCLGGAEYLPPPSPPPTGAVAELTPDPRGAACPQVRSCRKFLTALFALALWLGASQHCSLEAAGVLASHSDAAPTSGCCSGSEGGCASDGCDTVENGAFRNSYESVTLQLPTFSCCDCLICSSPVVPRVVTDPPMTCWHTAFERPLDWVPTWHFERRAALSPRAPSVVVA